MNKKQIKQEINKRIEELQAKELKEVLKFVENIFNYLYA